MLNINVLGVHDGLSLQVYSYFEKVVGKKNHKSAHTTRPKGSTCISIELLHELNANEM